MKGKNVRYFALLSLLMPVACGGTEAGFATGPAIDTSGAAVADTSEDGLGSAGMAAPEPGGAAGDLGSAEMGATSVAATVGAAGEGSDGEPAAGETGTGAGGADASNGEADPEPDTTDDGSSTPSTTPPAASDPAAAATPAFTSLADLEPSPNNIPQCPATAPENPWGPCVGVPVYAVCDYGTQPAPFYSCICDWIHWICVGVQ
ncbi:MAG: hypothetical protein OEZ06_22030 [Myxococcales bacterium]|nr:hypothetical protein [Myxococcales bacterium]